MLPVNNQVFRCNVQAAAIHYVSTMTSHRIVIVIGHVTVRLGIDDFLCILSRKQTRILLSFYDVIIDVITPGSAIHVDPVHSVGDHRLIPTSTL